MAAVPFGFSFGDFVAAIEVIHKVAQALKRSSGAQSNFHQAVADLETLESVLRQVEALSPTISSPDTINAIRLCAFKCHPPLDHFLHRIRAYEPRLSHRPKAKTRPANGITSTFWKIKWALKVEEEVVKLKAAIEPQLVAIGILLQIKDFEQNAAASQDTKQLLRLTQNVTSGMDRILLAMQEQALTTRRINIQTLDIRQDTQTIVQQIPQLATSSQLGNAVATIENSSSRLYSTAIRDQADELKSLLKTSSLALEKNHMEMMAVSERHEAQTLQMARTIQDMHNVLAVMRPPNLSDPHTIVAPMLGQSALMLPSSAASPSTSSKRRNQGRIAASKPYDVFIAVCRLFVSGIMALILMFPSMQSQLRTFITLLKSPRLLSSNSVQLQLETLLTVPRSPHLVPGNSITFIDALSRVKLLSYGEFSNWNMVKGWLETVFQGLPGESLVHRGQFALFTRKKIKTGTGAGEWEDCVFSGDVVLMVMRSRKRQQFGADMARSSTHQGWSEG
jgi:hypothetical protein